MRYRNRSHVVVLGVVAVLVAASCGQAATSASPTTPSQVPTATPTPTPPPEVTISWWGTPQGVVNVTGLESDTANNGDWERLMADRFTEAHPNVTIDYQLIAAEDITAKMTAAVLANQPPDVYWDAQLRQSQWAREADVIEDIASLLDAETIGAVNPDLIPLVTLNDAMYMLPTHVFPVGWMLYNNAIFEDLDISAPEDGVWSYDEFDEILAKVAVSGQRWPLAIRLADEQADTAWLDYLLGWGCRPFSADFTESTMNTPECERGLQWLADANRKGWLYPGVATISFGDLDTAWASGQTVFSRFGFNDAPARIKTWTDEGKVTVPLEPGLALYPHAPGVEPPGLISTLAGLQVFKQSDPYKLEMIGEFLRFMSGEDVMRPAATTARWISAHSAIGNPNPDDETFVAVDAWLKEYGPLDVGQTLPQYNAIRLARVPLVQAVVLGQMTPADALAEIDKQVDAILAGG